MLSLLAAVAATIVTLNGTPVDGALNQGGHIIVPLRAPMEAVGGKVDWSDTTQTGVASTSAGDVLLSATVGSQTVLVVGHPVAVDVSPQLVNGLEYVPVEMLAEISNATVTYVPDRSSATVTGFDLNGLRAHGTNDLGGVLPIWIAILGLGVPIVMLGIAFAAPPLSRRRPGQHP